MLRAYVVPFAVGDTLTDMPLFLEPGGHIVVPLETTYQTAFAAVPRRLGTVTTEPFPPTDCTVFQRWVDPLAQSGLAQETENSP